MRNWVLSCRNLSLVGLLAAQALYSQITFGTAQPAAPQSNTRPEDRCTVEGHISNAMTSEAVARAEIHAYAQSSGQSYSGRSAADGSFRIENMAPGQYRITANRNGYLGAQYGARKPDQPGSVIVLTPGQQLTGINIGLTPQAIITGKILDQDGDPVPYPSVSLVAQTWQQGKIRYAIRNGAGTNDAGEYRIANISAGKYYVVASKSGYVPNTPAEPDKPDIRAVKTFYPSALTIEMATPIQVQAGQNVSGIDIHLQQVATYHVRGKIVASVQNACNTQLNFNLFSRDDQGTAFLFGGGTSLTKEQVFDVAGVPPGSYVIQANTYGEPRLAARQELEVWDGDLNDVQVTLMASFSISGQLTFEGNLPDAAATARNTFINLTNSDNSAIAATVNNDETFTLENVTPGKYRLNVYPPAGTYLKSVRLQNQECLGKEFDLTPGAGPLTIVLSDSVAELTGMVQDSQNSPAGAAKPSSSIVFYTGTIERGWFRHLLEYDQPGRLLHIFKVRPGRYRTYAFEELHLDELQNPDILKQLENKGTEIELEEKDRKQIQLSVIPQEEMQQIYARAGVDPP